VCKLSFAIVALNRIYYGIKVFLTPVVVVPFIFIFSSLDRECAAGRGGNENVPSGGARVAFYSRRKEKM
jgi:hypothetical protein